MLVQVQIAAPLYSINPAGVKRRSTRRIVHLSKKDVADTNMQEILSGRRILVTGATSGLGWAMAQQLAINEGVHVLAVGRRAERLEQLANSITSAGGQVDTYCLDLNDRNAVAVLCTQLKSSGLDDLVLNAGITSATPFVEGSFALDQSIIETNLTANLQLIRELIEPLEQDKTGGRILLIASLGGLVPLPYQAVYAGSKAFIVNFGLSLREELKSHGICVLVFAPGGIATEMTAIDAMARLQNQLADPDRVAKDAIAMFIKRRSLVVPGWQNKLVALIARLLPRQVMASVAEKIYRNAGAE